MHPAYIVVLSGFHVRQVAGWGRLAIELWVIDAFIWPSWNWNNLTDLSQHVAANIGGEAPFTGLIHFKQEILSGRVIDESNLISFW